MGVFYAISSATEADGDHLSHRRRARLDEFPQTIADDDLIAYFTLSPADLALVPTRTGEHDRLGFALQLGALRYLGFCPADLILAFDVLHRAEEVLEIQRCGRNARDGAREQSCHAAAGRGSEPSSLRGRLT